MLFSKDGEKFKCGNPLAKDYISKMEDETLKSDGDESAERTLLLNKMISFWRNAKHRDMYVMFCLYKACMSSFFKLIV